MSYERNKVIFGVDPGYARCGFALLDGKKVEYWTLEPVGTMAQRMSMLYDTARRTCNTHRPPIVVIEQIMFGVNAKSAMQVAQARGALLAGISAGMFTHPYKLLEPYPSQMKKAVTGSGKADKKQIKKYLEAILGRELTGLDDSHDALGLCYFGQKQ
jgi:crossover junction endodeoxyribonuclease RuvC